MAAREKSAPTMWRVPASFVEFAERRTAILLTPWLLRQQSYRDALANAYLLGMQDAADVMADRLQ